MIVPNNRDMHGRTWKVSFHFGLRSFEMTLVFAPDPISPFVSLISTYLHICLCTCLYACLPHTPMRTRAHMSVPTSAHTSVHMSTHVHVRMSTHIPARMPIHMSAHIPAGMSTHMSVVIYASVHVPVAHLL